jgi:uncharacterized protein (TIGR00255 family)
MSIRSMTGYAQIRAQLNDQVGFALSLKSVNHRFLDLHLRMPPDSDALEMRLRRALKDKLARGHVDLTLTIERSGGAGFALNRPFIAGYVEAFRGAAQEFGVAAEPDLNAILKMPGAMEAGNGTLSGDEALEDTVLHKLEEAIKRLNDMRTEEGRAIDHELRERLHKLQNATNEVEKHRAAVLHAYLEKVQTRMQELLGGHADKDRILQEAALLAERSDIQEEIVRMSTHIRHFIGLLDKGGEIGKKLDFLLQEMNREANTLLSKTSGVAGEALRITELGLAMKAEIEKVREQVQNIE